MTDVRIDEVKKGDVCYMKKLSVMKNGVQPSRTMTVISVNKSRGTVLMKFRAKIDG